MVKTGVVDPWIVVAASDSVVVKTVVLIVLVVVVVAAAAVVVVVVVVVGYSPRPPRSDSRRCSCRTWAAKPFMIAYSSIGGSVCAGCLPKRHPNP